MTDVSTSRLVLLVTTLFTAGAIAGACSQSGSSPGAQPSDQVGSTELALRLPTGNDVQSVSYRITGNGITPLTGTINVPDPNAKVSVLVNGLPAGTGYRVELTATTTDGKTSCSGSATFDILAGQTTSVTVTLQCRTPGAGTGSVAVNGTFNACPAITGLTAAPLAVNVGQTIALTAAASDADAADTITYAWTAPAGTFATPAAASTTYACSTAGVQTLTITASDGKCNDTTTVSVTCTSATCGNGTVDQGEDCDPPSAATNCDPTCHFVQVCGNGRIERGEQCDPPNGTTCDSRCQTIVATPDAAVPPDAAPRPDAGVDAPLPPPDAAVDAPLPPPDAPVTPPDAPPPPPDMATSQPDAADTCGPCLAAQVSSGLCDPQIGCEKITTGAADVALCVALRTCMLSSHCAVNDPFDCFCGTASGPACLTGANGMCRQQVLDATKAGTDLTAAGTRFYDFMFPAGFATQQIGCEHDFCSTAAPPPFTNACKL